MDDFRFHRQLDELNQSQLSARINPFRLLSHSRTTLMEFGTQLVNQRHMADEQVAARFADVRRWIANVGGERVNASFFDTTTLVTVERMLLSDDDPSNYLSPLTLFDLTNFVNSVVLFDNIFHLENKHIDTRYLNSALGNEPVIISLPVEDFSPETYGDDEPSLSGILIGLWLEVIAYMREVEKAFKDPTRALYADAVEIKNAWATLGFDVEEPFGDSGLNDWESGGPTLLNQLLGIGTLGHHPDVVVRFGSQDEIYRLVSEANYRSLFNFMVGYLLELPYVPNSFRMPFRRFLLRRATTVHHHLLSLSTIEAEYKERARAFPIPIKNNLQLPFFTAAVLAKINSLDDFFEELVYIRRQAYGFRQHQGELEMALRQGDLKTARALQDALSDDAKQLGSKFPFAPIAAATSGALSALGSSLPAIAIGVIAILSGAAQLSPSEIEKLKKKVFTPRMWFLSNLRDVASSLTNALPKIEHLWGPISDPSEFVKAFAKIANLEQ